MGETKYNSGDSKESGRDSVVQTEPAPNHATCEEVGMAPAKRTTGPAFQFYPNDWLGGDKVSRMSYTETGIFITLLAYAWNGPGLPVSVTEIAKKLKLNPKRFASIWAGVLGECWVEKNGRLVNPKQERIRAESIAYRRRQADRATKGWQSRGNAAAMQGVHPSGNALLLQSSSSSSKERTERQGGAPIHQTHKTHAACGRVCVPGDLHGQFVRARNHDGADKELRDWYLAVDVEWSVGFHKDDSPGGNDYQFWRARFSEKWPPADKAAPKNRIDTWQPRTVAKS